MSMNIPLGKFNDLLMPRGSGGLERGANLIDSWEIDNFAEPHLGRSYISPMYCFIEASHSGYQKQGVSVKRRVLTIEDKALLVIDELFAKEEVTIHTRFHLDSGVEVTKQADHYRLSSSQASAQLFFEEESSIEVSPFPISKHYNELEDAQVITVSQTFKGVLNNTTVIGYGENVRKITLKRTPVLKALTKMPIPPTHASGFEVKIDDDLYYIAVVHQEYPQGGYLLRIGGCERYARIFIEKNRSQCETILY